VTVRLLEQRLPAGWHTARRLLVLAGIAALAVVLVGVGRMVFAGPPATPGIIPLSPAVEERYGVRLTQVGVSADGGLVDVRYIVLDPRKAATLTETDASVPKLLVERTGALVQSAALMGAKHDLRAGRTAFLLYRNTLGAIQRGTVITIVFGELRIEHVVAE
jgi:hypothetical protein